MSDFRVWTQAFPAMVATQPFKDLPRAAAPQSVHAPHRLEPQDRGAATTGGAGQAPERDMQLELMSKVLQQMEILNQTVSVMDRRLQLVEERMSYIEGADLRD